MAVVKTNLIVLLIVKPNQSNMKKLFFLLLSVFLISGFISAASYDKLYIVGNASAAKWELNSLIEMTKVSDGVFTWTGTLTDNSVDQARFKFLVDSKWEPSFTCRTNVSGHLLVSSGVEYDLYERVGGYDNAFQVSKTGKYTIDVNLNTMKIVVTEVEVSQNYEHLYIIGNASPAGWELNKLEAMTKVEDGVFTWTGTLIDRNVDNARFKFLVGKKWEPSFTCRKNVSGHLVINSGEEYDLFVRNGDSDGYDNAFQVPKTGIYTINVNLNTMKIKITEVKEDVIRSFFFDFGPDNVTDGNTTPSPDANSHYWNNIVNTSASSSPVSLIDSKGASVGYKLSLQSDFLKNGIRNGALLNPSSALLGDFAIATATQDYFFVEGADGTTGTMSLTGLDTSKAYKFYVFGSRDNTETRTGTFTFRGLLNATLDHQTSGTGIGADGANQNNNKISQSEMVFPDKNGNIYIDIAVKTGRFAYLNVLKMEELSEFDYPKVSSIEVLASDITTDNQAIQLQINATPSDIPIPNVTWSVSDDKLAWIDAKGMLHPLGNGTVTITATIAYSDANVVGTKNITLSNQIANDIDQVFYFDMGVKDGTNGNITVSPDANSHYWNNITTPSASSTSLVNSTNKAMGYQLEVLDNFGTNGINHGGLLNPSSDHLGDLAIATATQDFFFTEGSAGATKRFKLKNLKPGKGYKFHMFGSRSGTDERITTFTFTGSDTFSVDQQTTGVGIGADGANQNNNKIAVSKVITPNSSGEVMVYITVKTGGFAYINAMKVEEFANTSITLDNHKMAIMGSSVPRGEGASANMGYMAQYATLLTKRNSEGLGANWQMDNLSVNGNSTVDVMNRWNSDLYPNNSKYVLIALSLGNEGIHDYGQERFDRYRDNMLALINRARSEGRTPVVTNNYPRGDFNETDYNFVKQLNLLMHQWDVPSINLLGSIDNGAGRWADGLQNGTDISHPNTDGHTQMSSAIVPSMFDALDQGKALPERNTNTSYTINSTSRNVITFKPENEKVYPFTLSFAFKTNSTGTITTFGNNTDSKNIAINASGKLSYGTLTSTAVVNDNQWHRATITHYYGQGVTLLYIDNVKVGQVTEKFAASRFALGDEKAPATVAYKELFFYRAGMNAVEISALNEGKMLKSSLEIYSPLNDADSQNGLQNLALSLNTLKLEKLAIQPKITSLTLSGTSPYPSASVVDVAATIDAENPTITWTCTGGTIQGGSTLTPQWVLPAQSGTYQITLTIKDAYGEVNQTKEVKVIASGSDTSLEKLEVNGDEWNDLSLRYDMGIENELNIRITPTDPYATVDIGNNYYEIISKATLKDLVFTITSGEVSKQYTLKIERRYNFNDIITVKWNNTLIANLKKVKGDGFEPIGFQWYKGSQLLAGETRATYSAGENKTDLLDKNSEYYLAINTAEGFIRTSAAKPTLRSLSVVAYPNPVAKSETITLDADIEDSILEGASLKIVDIRGTVLSSQKVSERVTEIQSPSMAGTFFIQFVAKDGFVKTLKVIVK